MMGRRKLPKTSQEFHAELEYSKEQLRMAENHQKQVKNQFSAEERKLRTRRLCSEAGILEHYVPQLKEMTEEERERFIVTIATSPVATEFLEDRELEIQLNAMWEN